MYQQHEEIHKVPTNHVTMNYFIMLIMFWLLKFYRLEREDNERREFFWLFMDFRLSGRKQ